MKFTYIKFFLRSYKIEIFIFFFLSTINVLLLGINFIDLTPFVVRQCFIILYIIVRVYYPDLIASIIRDHQEVLRLASEKQPVLKLYNYVMLSMIPAIWLLGAVSLQEWIIQQLIIWTIIGGTFVHFYFLYVVLTIPEARMKYNIKHAIKTYGFRSVHTVKSAAMAGKEILWTAALTGFGYLTLDKAVNGVQHRSPLAVWAGERLTGMRSNHEGFYALGQTLKEYDPKLTKEFVGPDNEIDNKKLMTVASRVFGDQAMDTVRDSLFKGLFRGK